MNEKSNGGLIIFCDGGCVGSVAIGAGFRVDATRFQSGDDFERGPTNYGGQLFGIGV